MMWAQAKNLLPQYLEAGFTDVHIIRALDRNDQYSRGFVLTGLAYMHGQQPDRKIPFEIRSPKGAREFLKRYGPQQPTRV